MESRSIVPLGSKGLRLLKFLVGEIEARRIKKGKPESFIAYSEALAGMGISKKGRAGQQLQREGLNELNEWTENHPKLPKIAALIVNKQSRQPSKGFAKSHLRGKDDWETWWLVEAGRAIDFDWTPYLDQHSTATVREEETKVSNYHNLITIEPGKRGGRPCIRGLRITVGDILGWLAAGMSEAEIIDDFPDLTRADIHAALAFAAVRETQTMCLVTLPA